MDIPIRHIHDNYCSWRLGSKIRSRSRTAPYSVDRCRTLILGITAYFWYPPSTTIGPCALKPPIKATPAGTRTSRTLKQAKATNFLMAGQHLKMLPIRKSSMTVLNETSSSVRCGYFLPSENTSSNASRDTWRHDAMFNFWILDLEWSIRATNPWDARPIGSSGPSGLE